MTSPVLTSHQIKSKQVEVDIRCDRPDTAAVTFLRRLVASHPAFIPVATLLKLLLHQGGMDKVGGWVGGIV